MIETERLQSLQPLVARRCGKHGSTGALGQLNRGDTYTTGACLHQDCFSLFELAELEQAIVGSTERHGDGRRQLDVEPFRHWPRIARRHRAQGSVRSGAKDSSDLLTYLQVGHFRTYLNDFTAGLVANYMRFAG